MNTVQSPDSPSPGTPQFWQEHIAAMESYGNPTGIVIAVGHFSTLAEMAAEQSDHPSVIRALATTT